MVKTKLKLLVVDDEEVDLIYQAVEIYNEDSEDHQFEIVKVKNEDSALLEIFKEDFSGIIIDLNLKDVSTKSDQFEGNTLISIISKRVRVPIIVWSGTPENFNFKGESTHNLIKVYDKSDDFIDILKKIIMWNMSPLYKTFGTSGTIQRAIDEIFWHKISDNLNEWGALDNPDLENSFIRYTLNTMHNFLEIDESDNQFEDYHPAEMYIKPPFNTNYEFGDILNYQEEYYMIMTPACDLANGKTDNILILKIVNYVEIEEFGKAIKKYRDSDEPTKKNKESLEKWFRNGHKLSNRYHFLPAYSDFRGGFIDFQNLKIEKVDSVTKKIDSGYCKIATITSEFAKDISSRYTSYYVRQGQPNFNNDVLFKHFKQ